LINSVLLHFAFWAKFVQFFWPRPEDELLSSRVVGSQTNLNLEKFRKRKNCDLISKKKFELVS